MEYTLTESEQSFAATIAARRQEYNNANRITNRKQSPQSDEYITRIGYGGEIAYARMVGLDLDTSHTGDKGADFVLPNGKTVDVKVSTHGKSMSVAASKESKPCHWYVLLLCRWPMYEVVGFASAREVFRPEHRRANIDGKGFYFHVPASSLRKVRSLDVPTTEGIMGA